MGVWGATCETRQRGTQCGRAAQGDPGGGGLILAKPRPLSNIPAMPKEAPRLIDQLRPKPRVFAEHFVVHRHAGKAAIEAGYSKATAHQMGYKLLHHAAIAAAINQEIERIGVKLQMDATWLRLELLENARRAQWDGDYAASTRALELIGKLQGLFVEKLRVDLRRVAELTDEELEEQRRALGLT